MACSELTITDSHLVFPHSDPIVNALPFRIIRTTRKHSIGFRFTAHGQLDILAPKRATKTWIYALLTQNQDRLKNWYLRFHTYRQDVTSITAFRWVLLGKPLILQFDAVKHFRHDGQTLAIPDRFQHESERVQAQAIINWYRKTAAAYIRKLVQELAPNLGVTPKRIAIKHSTSRWGSCSALGNLNFTWHILQAPLPVLRYLVIHEMAHLKHPNHSRDFWQFVATHDPDFHMHKTWLKHHQVQLHDVNQFL